MTDFPEPQLPARFAAVVHPWGAPATHARQIGASLVARYAEPHRRYHTVAHLEAVLDALFVDLAGDPDAVTVAAWYHDAVYDPKAPSGANERASADLAALELRRLGAPEAAIATVLRLVMMTVDHRVSVGDGDAAVLADADLSILGADPSVYARYAAAVREEYGWLTASEWRVGRSAVVRGLLGRRRVYATDRGRDRWERAARDNLGAELSALLAEA